ncbi:MAG TPA: dephospho-CoA kinase [Fimbriimonadaceae bacterium]|nr:dephospho-CoA kinase [Fimbriimonadaceae bacterium]
MPPFSLGITGGIAEGKTTVLRMLAELGYSTASADEAAKEALEDELTQRQVAEVACLKDGFSRQALADAIASSAEVRRRVNSTLHTEVLARLLETRAQVIEAPLLVESCIQSMFKRVWVVRCGLEEQRKRLLDRLGDSGRAQALLSLQLPASVKSCFADHIVRTDRPLAAVLKQVEELAVKNLRF